MVFGPGMASVGFRKPTRQNWSTAPVAFRGLRWCHMTGLNAGDTRSQDVISVDKQDPSIHCLDVQVRAHRLNDHYF